MKITQEPSVHDHNKNATPIKTRAVYWQEFGDTTDTVQGL